MIETGRPVKDFAITDKIDIGQIFEQMAISWGKMTKEVKQTTIHAELTTILPFICRTLLAKIK